MRQEELQDVLDELHLARHYIDRAITSLTDLLHAPSSNELSLKLAELEGWAEMEKYMSDRGRKDGH